MSGGDGRVSKGRTDEAMRGEGDAKAQSAQAGRNARRQESRKARMGGEERRRGMQGGEASKEG